MRAAIGLAVAGVILTGVALVAARMAAVERHLADTREALATLDYPQAAGSVEAATKELGIARYVPGFGDRVQREARAAGSQNAEHTGTKTLRESRLHSHSETS